MGKYPVELVRFRHRRPEEVPHAHLANCGPEVGDARRRPEVPFCGHLCARDQQMGQADCASMKQPIQKSRLLFRNPPRLEA